MARLEPIRRSSETRRFGVVTRIARRRRYAFTLGIILLIVFLSVLVPVRVALKSAGFFIEIFPDMPAYPLRWVTDEPELSLISFPHDGTSQSAYYYRPTGSGCYSGLILYIGMGPEHRDPHLDRAARAFARNGIAVLVPASDAMVDYEIAPDEHEYAVSAFRFLQSLEEIHPERVGMFGVSVGGSIVANAATEPEIRHNVAMVHSLGGYYDAFDLLAAVALGGYEAEGEWIHWEPSSVTIRVIRDAVLGQIPEEDRAELWDLITERGEIMPDGLTPEGEALSRLMINRDPERVSELVAGLPDDLSRYMRQISPAYSIEDLHANTLLLHDRFDYVIPYSESLRFYEEYRNRGTVHLTFLEVFHHVRPDEEGDRRTLLRDGIRLYRHIYTMNRYLDGRDFLVPADDLVPFVGGSSGCN